VGRFEYNSRPKRRRSQAAGLAASLALHALILIPLALALRVTTLFPPAPVIDVQIVRMEPNRPEAIPPSPPKPEPRAKQAQTPPATAPIPSLAPPAPVPQVMDEATRQRLLAAPFGQRSASAKLKAGAACIDDYVKLSEADRERCRRQVREAAVRALPGAGDQMDPAKRSAFDEAKRSDEAWERYRDSASMRGYPGLRNAFGRNGGPPPPPSAYDKAQSMGPSYRREDPNNPSGGL
jgi:hypothetical protein